MWKNNESILAKKLLEDGYKYEEISSMVGKSYNSVKLHLNKKYGIKQSDFKDLRDSKKPKKKCFYCKSEMIEKTGKERKFCSVSCSNKARKKEDGRKPVAKFKESVDNLKYCLNCNGEVNIQRNYFCSQKCHIEYNDKAYYEKIKLGDLKDSSRKTIKRILLKLRGHRCEICSNEKWNNENIPIVLDHIDGDHNNNLETNLRLICPNCDAQLPTYKGANKGKGRKWRKKYYDVN